MSTTHQRFPTYKARKQSAKNDFHNQYRNEIKELISGTEYLDQIRSNGRIGTKENKKDENKDLIINNGIKKKVNKQYF